MNIVIVSSEIAPFSKTGGLADVCGSLGPALVQRGHRVVTVSPKHGHVHPADYGAFDTGIEFGIHAGGWLHTVRYWEVIQHGVHHVLVDHPMFHRDGVYGDARGAFTDNHLRFAVLCRAALEVPRRIAMDGELLGENVMFHAHDWPTALVSVFLEALYRPLGLYAKAASVLTIHNLAHQGRYPGSLFRDLDLAPRWFSPEGLEWHGDLGLLKGGLLTADLLTTVSPTYAREIRESEQGFGLDELLRHRSQDLIGILNGIDTELWDPNTDPHLPAPFSAGQLQGKAVCKASLQAELGLPVLANVPLICTIGRLDPQKGIELLLEAIPAIVRSTGAQFAIVGSAAAAHIGYEHRLRELQAAFPNHVCTYIGFSERLAHQVEAGADLFVMPSRFEPCGLNQLYSMRYGTIPVVRATGGLADSVIQLDQSGQSGTGFVFYTYETRALIDTLRYAIHIWYDQPEIFANLQRRAMEQDISWSRAITSYEEVYTRAFQKRD